MPFGPGTYGMGGGQPAPSPSGLGVPEQVLPTGNVGAEELSEIVQMIRGGQAGGERFLQLLSLLASQSVPQMDSAPQGPGMKGPGDIAGLLGG